MNYKAKKQAFFSVDRNTCANCPPQSLAAPDALWKALIDAAALGETTAWGKVGFINYAECGGFTFIKQSLH
jgi:hypothetical protein